VEADKIASVAQAALATTSRRVVRSAMTPIIYVCLGVSPCFLAASYFLRDDVFLSRTFGLIATLPVLFACGMFVYFGIFKTDKLQSEDYQIKQELLQIALSKGGKIKIEPFELDAILDADPDAIEHLRRAKK